MKNITQEEIITLLEKNFKKKVSMSDNLRYDIGMDSIDEAEFVVELEKRLGSQLPEEKINEIKTVQDAWDCVQEVQNGIVDKGE